MDQQFAQWLSTLGVGGVLAAVFFYQNNKNSQDYAAQLQKASENYSNQLRSLLEIERGRTDMLMSVIREVTSVIARNTASTEAFHRRLDVENADRTDRGHHHG